MTWIYSNRPFLRCLPNWFYGSKVKKLGFLPSWHELYWAAPSSSLPRSWSCQASLSFLFPCYVRVSFLFLLESDSCWLANHFFNHRLPPAAFLFQASFNDRYCLSMASRCLHYSFSSSCLIPCRALIAQSCCCFRCSRIVLWFLSDEEACFASIYSLCAAGSLLCCSDCWTSLQNFILWSTCHLFQS